ncbi:hypothetical protein HAX54_008281 [Datura stramonium]|uniref:Putative plant transposon protein domain-containing protein n=1 Tax=Datura stramonium TaxID=4076 RepID=A0ABS8TEI7_DATST|nr:hypothetical protein [Datura stramonium]
MSSFGGWSRHPKEVPCMETIKLVDKMWHREGKKDAMLLVMMKQMELLTNYMKGFHARCNQANHDYDYFYYGNKGWNNARSVDTSSQKSNESIPPHMESTLEVVLEKVLATKEGVQDLRSKLLDLTTSVMNNDVIINQLEEWMNKLTSQMAIQAMENNNTLMQDNVENDIVEWEIEEEVVGEIIADVFLKGEEFEEVHHVKETTNEVKGQHCSRLVPHIGVGATKRGAYNSRSNQFNLLGRANPISSNIPQQSGKQSHSIPMGSNLIAQGQPQWAISKGLVHQHDLKFEARMWLDLVFSRLMPSLNTSEVPIEVSILLACIIDHVHINVGEIIADQFKRKAKQQATALPFPNLVCMLCMRETCPLFWPLDRMVQANGVITLATKIHKEALVMKREKFTRNMTLPSSSTSTHNATAPLHTAEPQSSPPPDLLKIAQRAEIHENQLVWLAKALPSMIQGALKKAL